jgi:hypothetical protein
MSISVELYGERLSSGAQCRNHLSFQIRMFLGSLYTRGMVWDGLWFILGSDEKVRDGVDGWMDKALV